jgi:hypothetical protein
MALKLTEHRVEYLKFFPTMTGWFKPVLLSKLLLSVIISETFGQYADRRLVHAALDKRPLTPAEGPASILAFAGSGGGNKTSFHGIPGPSRNRTIRCRLRAL